ncbi:MAG: NYN domain-containing protein [Bacteriovoracaceae bacterium]|nr:NYN domain-containing protein [Bacteriovoracaceae bacterium]
MSEQDLYPQLKSKKKVVVYVDGFNLYYGCLKDSKYRWLDLLKLSKLLLSDEYEIVKINYFTAHIIDHGTNGSTTRQGFYLNALKTIPNLEIKLGKFKKREKTVYVNPPLKIINENPFGSDQRPLLKSILKGTSYEEKGTDVNLAVQLIIDLYENNFDVAMVISNDSDYLSALEKVRQKKKGLFIINTKLDQLPQHEMRRFSMGKKVLTEEKLKSAQFSEMVGNIRIPKEWE